MSISQILANKPFSLLPICIFILHLPRFSLGRQVHYCSLVEFKSFLIFITREGNYIVPGKAQVFLRFHLPPEWSKLLQMCVA